MNDQSFQKKRGKHPKSWKIATDEMEALMYAHLIEIPHRKSHYKHSQMLYFENSALMVKDLYNLFKEFYFQKKNEPLKMKLKQYYKLFQKFKFSVKDPKTDEYDMCETIKIKLRRNPTDIRTRVAKRKHDRMTRRYKKLKAEILTNIPNDTVVIRV